MIAARGLQRARPSASAVRHAKCLPVLLLLAALCLPAARAQPVEDRGIEVGVEFAGELVTITASFHVEATPREAWEVMVDYDHAVDFISDLEFSRIVAREGNAIEVHQKGKTRYGPFSFPVESVRKIQLTPFGRMESRTIRGSMQKLDGTTLLNAEGAGTRVTHRTEMIPGVWMPPILGRLFIQHETSQKFRELRDEILRRRKTARPD